MGRVVMCFAAGIILVAASAGCGSVPTATATPQSQKRQPDQSSSTPRTAGPVPTPVPSESAAASEQFVVADVAEERLGPSSTAAVTSKVYRGQAVTVHETKSGWSRVSQYYDGRVEGMTGQVARWIKSSSLASTRPAEAKGMNIPADPRIPHLTRVPGNGLSVRDVLVLHAAARYYLEIGRAKGIEDGDKSVSKPGTYFLNFTGEVQNTFFRPSDIPDLERRIQDLQK